MESCIHKDAHFTATTTMTDFHRRARVLGKAPDEGTGGPGRSWPRRGQIRPFEMFSSDTPDPVANFLVGDANPAIDCPMSRADLREWWVLSERGTVVGVVPGAE